MRVRPWLVVCSALLVATAIGGAVGYHKLLRWRRFDVVEPGVLYRSGILKDWQLRRAIQRYGIKTVFSFTFTNHRREEEVCREEGVRRYFQYLPGDGVGTDDPYLRFLQIAQDPANHPILVHCSAGVQRTGGAVALYRIFFQRWRFEDAVAEMIAKGNEGEKAQIAQLRDLYEDVTWTTAIATESPASEKKSR